MIDQIKIGSFISSCRKSQGWTQSRLAEELGITDKAVSKWETGRSLPDLSLFTPLCRLLGISVNELLAGEYISAENLREKSDETLLNVIAGWLGQDLQEAEDKSAASDSPDHLLVLKDVRKIYRSGTAPTLAVNNVSFQIPRSRFIGIMGASGSGKTTLLNLIAAIDKPTDGAIELDGQNIADLSEKELARFRREHLGFIFQDYNLLDTLTVYENIALALTVKEYPKENIRRLISDTAEKLEISDILHKFPCEVSGGQRQRCACARAIVMNPSLILADEPTGALDSHSAKQLLETLVKLCREYGATVLMVTHDAVSASYCDRILFMRDGEIKAALDRVGHTKQSFFTNILEKMSQIMGDAQISPETDT